MHIVSAGASGSMTSPSAHAGASGDARQGRSWKSRIDKCVIGEQFAQTNSALETGWTSRSLARHLLHKTIHIGGGQSD